MKGILSYIFLGCILLLTSCQREREAADLKVSLLRGPSAIAFAQWLGEAPRLNGRTLLIEILDSPDKIQAALIKKETDIAVLPMISAANLYTKGVDYRLAGCPIWGTLYLVTKETPRSLYLFGAGTTPDILTRHYLGQKELTYPLNYTFSTPQEILQGILAGKVKTAVLSEPFLSIALQKDSTLTLWADLNHPDESSLGFAQTAIVYHHSLEKERQVLDSLLQASCLYATQHPLEAIRILEEKGVFPPGTLTPASIERCKIQYLPASEAQENIYAFLRLIYEYEPKAIGGKLPAPGFISH